VKSTDPPLGFGTIPAVSVTGDPAIAVFRAGVREVRNQIRPSSASLAQLLNTASPHDQYSRRLGRRGHRPSAFSVAVWTAAVKAAVPPKMRLVVMVAAWLVR